MTQRQWRVIGALMGTLFVAFAWATLGVPLAFSSAAPNSVKAPASYGNYRAGAQVAPRSLADKLAIQSAQATATPSIPVTTSATITSPASLSTPAPGQAIGPYCIDNSMYVADVTVPDGTILSAGQAFTKIWRLRNTGTCTWGPGYTFAFIGGEAMTTTLASVAPMTLPGQAYSPAVPVTATLASTFTTTLPSPTAVPEASVTATLAISTPATISQTVTLAIPVTNTLAITVPTTLPGQTVDLAVPLAAPTTPGIHIGYWRLRAPTGEFFGQTPFVKINILGAVAPSYPPYNVPPYGYGYPQYIYPPCGYYPCGYGYPPYLYPPYGYPVYSYPTQSCYGSPSIEYFQATATTITVGSSTTLQWGLVGNANYAVIDNGIGGVSTPGSLSVSPGSTTTYTLTGYCGSTTTSAQVTITVNPAPSPATPTPTPTATTAVFKATLPPPRHQTVVPGPAGPAPEKPGSGASTPAATQAAVPAVPTTTPVPLSPAPQPRSASPTAVPPALPSPPPAQVFPPASQPRSISPTATPTATRSAALKSGPSMIFDPNAVLVRSVRQFAIQGAVA